MLINAVHVVKFYIRVSFLSIFLHFCCCVLVTGCRRIKDLHNPVQLNMRTVSLVYRISISDNECETLRVFYCCLRALRRYRSCRTALGEMGSAWKVLGGKNSISMGYARDLNNNRKIRKRSGGFK